MKEALGIDLPKTSQLSPWWRDRLTQEQIAYAALDAVFALKLEAALTPKIVKLSNGPDGKTLQSRLCEAVGPVARMELAGITLDREALAKQANAWDHELTTLKNGIAKLGISNPSSARQVATWLGSELARLDGTNATNLASNWPRTPSGSLSTTAKHLRQLANDLPAAAVLVRFSQLEQLRSNFGDKLLDGINRQTGRLHGSFQLAKAKSGRFSSSNPNMQNIPRSELVSFGLRCATWQAAHRRRPQRLQPAPQLPTPPADTDTSPEYLNKIVAKLEMDSRWAMARALKTLIAERDYLRAKLNQTNECLSWGNKPPRTPASSNLPREI